MSNTEETKTIENQEAHDWAWDIDSKFLLRSKGTIFLEMLQNAKKHLLGGIDGAESFMVERLHFNVSPDQEKPGTGSWVVRYGKPGECGEVAYADTYVPAVYISTPDAVIEEETDTFAKQKIPDSFDAAEFAEILAVALNMYAELSKQYFQERATPAIAEATSPFVTSWKFLQEHIVPALKAQIVKAMQEEAEKNKETTPVENEPIIQTQFPRQNQDTVLTVKMLRFLADLALNEANRLEQ